MTEQTRAEGAFELQPGAVLAGRFRLEARLGAGGFGQVFRASELLPDGSTVREVALKVLSPGQASADWGREAKVLASLRHPSLVTVFSAGLLDVGPGLPFVAMELLEGETLSAVLEARGKVAWRRVLSWAQQIASALDAIHGQGIVHLDLKPANLLLGRDGAVTVLDFGIARHVGSVGDAGARAAPRGGDDSSLGTGALLELEGDLPTSVRQPPLVLEGVVGTPGFIAPEVLEGRAAGPSADAYALGACVFQLLSGRLPQRARPMPRRGSDGSSINAWKAEIRASTVAGDLLELSEVAPRVPSQVATLVRKLLSLDPGARPAPGALSKLVGEVAARPYGAPIPPYLGLDAYGASAEGFLFGRDADIGRIALELSQTPVLVLQGASGSGKSSLAVAGVVPQLARWFVDGCDDWVPAVVRPGQDIDSAIRKAREQAPAGAGVVLVVDQLEEVATQLDSEQKARFLLALQRHAAPGGEGAVERGLRVLCTLREDFTTRVAAIGTLGRLLERGLRFVPPPSASSVRDIVVTPAELSGARVDDERPVVDEVLRELRSGEGRLPLVAFALSEWWKTRHGDLLSSQSWLDIGGVAGALSRHADQTLSALGEHTRPAARDLLLSLVTPERTSARCEGKELSSRSADHARALDAFVAARLVTLDDEGRAALSHDALIVAWHTLVAWLDEERADRDEARRLAEGARLYREAHARERDDLLMRGVTLARALELSRRRPDLSAPFDDFLRASKKRASLERLRAVVIAVLALATVAAAAGLWVFNLQQHERDLRLREDNMSQLKAQADAIVRRDRELVAELEAERARAAASSKELKGCRDTVVRIEQEHRRSLASRFAEGSFEQKVAHFLLQFEALFNLHDADRLLSFFAPEVSWFGVEGTREELLKRQAEIWEKAPSNRMLIGEISVAERREGQVVVRITRDERVNGAQSLSLVQLVIRVDKPERIDSFRLEKGSVEKIIVSGKALGCPTR